MTVDSYLPTFRQDAEANMTATCVITRAGASKGTFNTTTGKYDGASAPTTIYTGKCRVQIKSVIASSSDADAGDRRGVVQDFELQLPVDGTAGIAVNDVAEILTSPLDDSLVGRKFTIAARHEKSQATARRLRVTEVTA